MLVYCPFCVGKGPPFLVVMLTLHLNLMVGEYFNFVMTWTRVGNSHIIWYSLPSINGNPREWIKLTFIEVLTVNNYRIIF